jgi:prepilin peptidase CpaA
MIVPTFILTIGLIDDLLTKKVHNALVAFLFVIAAIFTLLQGQVVTGLFGLIAAVAIFFPLFALRVIGAGDAKLMMVFGLATSAPTIVSVALYALVWAGVFGVTKMALSQNWQAIKNVAGHFATCFRLPVAATESLPMTFPLLLGWLTYLHLQGLSS